MALLVLITLGCFLIGVCYEAQGIRSSALAMGTTLVVLAALAWTREARSEECLLRLARELGLPRDVRLVVSREGIAEQSGPEYSDPSRTFAWSEVVDVARVDHLTVIRLRPAGGVLIVPDAAFASAEARAEFEQTIRARRNGPALG